MPLKTSENYQNATLSKKGYVIKWRYYFTVRIESINIAKSGNLENINLIFKKPLNNYFGNLSINVLVGENGTGKTTILKAISEAVMNDNHSDIEISYSMVENARTVNPCSKVIISTFSPHKQFKTVRNRKFSYIGPTSSNKLCELFLPLIKIVSSNDFKKQEAIQNLLDEIGYTSIPKIELDETMFKDDFINSLDEKRQRILRQIRDHFENNLLEDNEKRYITVDSLLLYTGGATQWVKDIKRFRVYNNFRVADLWFKSKNENHDIPLTNFSSGELTLYYRFFRLIDVIEDNSIVLIDEPETHLHPRWIQKYIKLLKDIFNKFKAHMIIATHSPLITSDIPMECITGLKKDKISGRIVEYKLQERTMGTSPREILVEVFGVENYFGELTLESVSNIRRLIQQKKFEEALRFFNDLGDSELKFELFVQLEQSL